MAIMNYKVIVSGAYLIENLEVVKQNLLEAFDLPANQLQALLSGKALVVKKNLAPGLAMKFQKALRQAGLDASVQAMDEDLLDSPTTFLDDVKPDSAQSAKSEPSEEEVTVSASTQNTSVVQTATTTKDTNVESPKSSFRVAPLGARVGPRPAAFKGELPKTDHLATEHYERLAPEAPPAPAPPNVDHLSLDQLGAQLGQEKPQSAPPEMNQKLVLDEPGVILVEPKDVKPLEIDTKHLSFAEKSSD